MSIEGPVCVSVIARLPNATIQIAGFQLLMSLALFLESAAIDLLSTATTLADSRGNYLAIRKFVFSLLFWGTLIHAGFVFTPLYPLVAESLMRIPHETAHAARIGLMVMVPWSAFIGWRRFHQGILIRYGKTRIVGIGTMVRLITLVTVSGALLLNGQLSGCVVAGIALICSVFVESVFAHLGARMVIREHLSEDKPSDKPALTAKQVATFHFPLSATTLVMFLGMPMISSALAQSAGREASMAAWQMANAIVWLTRAVVYALPEVVITLAKTRLAAIEMRKFCVKIGLICSGIVLLASFTGLSSFLLKRLFHADETTIDAAWMAFVLSAPIPFIAALQSYCRGMLTRHHLTSARLWAICFEIVVLFAGLQLCLYLKADGIIGASIALLVSLTVELGVLYYFWSRWRGKDKG